MTAHRTRWIGLSLEFCDFLRHAFLGNLKRVLCKVGNRLPISVRNTSKYACNLPEDLQREIAAKYPGAKVVNLPDLEQDDRGFFQKDHGKACPGLTTVDFYGDGKPTFALVLTKKGGANAHTELVVAHDVGERWKVAVLGTGGPSPYAPAVWSQPPGQYQDIDGKKSIRATSSVIVFCKYESWEILYAWTAGRVAKIWLRD